MDSDASFGLLFINQPSYESFFGSFFAQRWGWSDVWGEVKFMPDSDPNFERWVNLPAVLLS